MRTCCKCKEEKILDKFRNDKYTRDGKTTRCKECLKTYEPEEAICYYCKEWFTKKQSNFKFCKPKCHSRYWSRVWRLSTKGHMYMLDYNRNYIRPSRI